MMMFSYVNKPEIHNAPITPSKITPPIFLGVAEPKNKVTNRTIAAHSQPQPNAINATGA